MAAIDGEMAIKHAMTDDPWDDWFYAKTGKLHSGESNAMHARSTYTELLVSGIKSTINCCILNLVYDTVELCAAWQ